jgi:hypothetical protein
MSKRELAAAMVATTAGLAAVVSDGLSSDSTVSEPAVLAGLAAAVTVGFAVLLFGWVLPRAKGRPARTTSMALVTSAIGFFSVASAWRGLPFVLGTGGAMLGTAARRETAEPRQRSLAGLAVALGVVAVALAGVAFVAI